MYILGERDLLYNGYEAVAFKENAFFYVNPLEVLQACHKDEREF